MIKWVWVVQAVRAWSFMNFMNGNSQQFDSPGRCNCPITERCCADGSTCVPLINFCDGQSDCADHSDEQPDYCGCSLLDSFLCNDQSCIDRVKVCNLHNDCLDGEDEIGCEAEVSCGPNQLRCHKNNVCITISDWCNGSTECPDGEDEEHCENVNHHNFECADGSIISKMTRVCDGNKDCPGGEDERVPGCQQDACDGFQCGNGRCIPSEHTCDNDNDCGDGSDESVATCSSLTRTCHDDQFQCVANKYCIDASRLCNAYDPSDHRIDCVDGSDESVEMCAEFECANPNRAFKCTGVTEPPYCIPEHWVNDGMADCQNGIDEEAACALNTWRCAGEDICLPMTSVCDGFEQCYDGSDEGDHCEAECHGPLGEHCVSCIQTPRGPACICESGFELDAEMQCADINECELVNGGCGHLCVNTLGSYKCECFDGHYLDGEGVCRYGNAKDMIKDEILYGGLDTKSNSFKVIKHVQSTDGSWREITYPIDSMDNQIIRVYQNATEGTTFVVTMRDIQLLRRNARQTDVIFNEPSIYIDDGVIDWSQGKMFLTCYFADDTPGTTGIVLIDLTNDQAPWTKLTKFDHSRPMSGYYSTLTVGDDGLYYTWRNNIGYVGFDGVTDFSTVATVDSIYTLGNIVSNPDTRKLYFTMTGQSDQQIGVCQLLDFECSLLLDEMEELNRKLEHNNPIGFDMNNDILYVIDSPAHRPRSRYEEKSIMFAINANSMQLVHSWSVDANMTRTMSVIDPSYQAYNLHGSCTTGDSDKCVNGICLDYTDTSACYCQNGYSAQSTRLGKSLRGVTTCSEPVLETLGDDVHTVLFGVHAETREIYLVGYNDEHDVLLGPMRILDTASELRLAKQVRLDSFDRALLVLTQFAIYKTTWGNDGMIPRTDIKVNEYVNFFQTMPTSNSLQPINLFDFDVESGTVCWGSTAGCWLQCKAREGKVFTIWDEKYLFSRNLGQTSSMSDFDFTRCPEVVSLAPGGLLYIISKAKYTHGDLDRDFSTVVVFNDQVYRHGWDPSLVDGFDEEAQFYPSFMLFTNRTEQPHQIDQSFFVVEQSDVNQRIRIGQGIAGRGSLDNTIKFSISQGQRILDVQSVNGEIWIQADNSRMTILSPDHIEQRFTWKQMYVDDSSDEHIGFRSFDVISRDTLANRDYPCRYATCDQLCRDSRHAKLPNEIVIDGDDHGDYICSCSRDYNKNPTQTDVCISKPECHHTQMMCDYDPLNPTEQTDYKCLGIESICDGVDHCHDGSDEGFDACLHKKTYTCDADQFACPTERRCINGTSVCDGTLDCAINTAYSTIDMVLGAEDYHTDEDRGYCLSVHECAEGSRQCSNGWQCVPEGDDATCYAGDADEAADTTTGCPNGTYQCTDGKCISTSWLCDGEDDCDDGADEKECEECNGTAFLCPESKHCIPIIDVCDGYKDCSNGDDEHDDCGADYNEHHGRYANHRHASIEVNSTMEYHSRGASMICDNSAEFHCRNSWRKYGSGAKCIPLSEVCDGTTQCNFNDDEYPYPDNYNYPRGTENEVEHLGDVCATACDGIDRSEWGCDGPCIATPDGPTCICPPGLYFDNSLLACVDVDECELHDRCTQECVNFHGGYECRCADGYSQYGSYCRAEAQTAVISILESRVLVRMGADNFTTLMDRNESTSVSFTYDYPIISLVADADMQMIYFVDQQGLLRKFDIRHSKSQLLSNYAIEDALKIELDSVGQQLIVQTNSSSLILISTNGNYMTKVIDYKQMNDFVYCNHYGRLFYITDYSMRSCNLDGSNDIELFSSTKTKFYRLALDVPAKRIFYITSGMPDSTYRVMSAKYDGSDKFRHYVLPRNVHVDPSIRVFENGLIIHDRNRNSPVFYSKKFNTNTALYSSIYYDRAGLDLIVMNEVLNSAKLMKHSRNYAPYKGGVYRIAHTQLSDVSALINMTLPTQPDEVFGCAGSTARGLVPLEHVQPCPKQCPDVDISSPAYAMKQVAQNTMTITCSSGFRVPIVNQQQVTVTCDDGLWSGPFQCAPVQCRPLGLLEELTLGIMDFTNLETFTPGTNATIKCLKGSYYKGQEQLEIQCLPNGGWSVDPSLIKCTEPECSDPAKFKQAHGRLLDPILKLVGMGVNTNVAGYNSGDKMNISCRHSNGYVVNTDRQWVEAVCRNHSWIQSYLVQFTDEGEEYSTLPLNGSLPACYMTKPRFESLHACETGCEAGLCMEDRYTGNGTEEAVTDGYICECAPGHSGFHCKSPQSAFKLSHLWAILLPIFAVFIGALIIRYTCCRSDEYRRTLLFEDDDNENPEEQATAPKSVTPKSKAPLNTNYTEGFLSTYRNRTESKEQLITNPGYDEKYSEETTD